MQWGKKTKRKGSNIVFMINVSGLKKKYGKQTVLEDISFSANCGEKVVIVGMNGCGKSTLMQILAGVMKADAGSVSFFGNEAIGNMKVFRSFCGYVPQDNPLMEELTVKDNLLLWKGRDNSVRDMIISQFELKDILGKRVSELSGGMKRRLSIACALLKWPPILLLDEPTTALDLYYKNSIGQWINEYCKMNGIVIMTTHDESEILSADRCLFMENGKIRDVGKVTDITRILKELENGKEI